MNKFANALLCVLYIPPSKDLWIHYKKSNDIRYILVSDPWDS